MCEAIYLSDCYPLLSRFLNSDITLNPRLFSLGFAREEGLIGVGNLRLLCAPAGESGEQSVWRQGAAQPGLTTASVE